MKKRRMLAAPCAAVLLAVVDAQNNTVTTFTGTITLTLLNAGGAVLGGSTDMSACRESPPSPT